MAIASNFPPRRKSLTGYGKGLIATMPLRGVEVLALFALRFALAQSSLEPSSEPQVWTWCVEDISDKEKCEQMVAILDRLDANPAHSHACTVGRREEGCMQMVRDGYATFLTLDGAEIFTAASDEFQLEPIRVEISELSNDHFYYSVGVVKEGQCPESLKKLAGKRSCHTGYGRAAGWVLPVTKLIHDSKVMPIVTSGQGKTDIKSVKSFFSKSCAASTDPETSICSACKSGSSCTEADEYYDYAGAFRGLVEGACDIAFTKHTIPLAYAQELAPAQRIPQASSSYRIVCPSGKHQCTDTSNWLSCNFGRAPGHAIMVSRSWKQEERDEFNALMDRANNDREFSDLFFTGLNVKGSLFAPDAIRTENYSMPPESLMGALYDSITILAQINKLDNTPPADFGLRHKQSVLLQALLCWLVYEVFLL